MIAVPPPEPAALEAYLRRIQFAGEPRADLATLRELHWRHLRTIPYDALDVPLGRRVTLDPRDAYRKIILDGRGGWCYEMNGLFGWMLEAIGFEVMRVGATVMREDGQRGRGDHLVLIVRVDDRRYVADVGFGEGPQVPFPLAPERFEDLGIEYTLARLPSRWWRLCNESHHDAPWFDFQARPAGARTLEATNRRLQRDPASPFVLNAVVARGTADGSTILRGRVLRTVRGAAWGDRRIDTLTEYQEVLRDVFDLHLPEAATLWPRVVARHETLFGPDDTH